MYIIKVFNIEVTNQICPGNRWYHSYYASKSLPQNSHPPHQLFKHILRTGYFPSAWKSTKIIPILKPGQPLSDPGSHRHISLLSIVRKLLEQVVAHRLNSFIHQNHILSSEQFSFCKEHSAVSHLARIANFITHGFNLRKHTGIVLLDIEEASDTVWLNGLLCKLISLHFLDFPLFFLLGRSYLYCSPERLYLHPKPTPSGLPQSAVLSTTPFSLYLSDMPHPPHTYLTFYADDPALLSQSWWPDTIFCRLSNAVIILL